MSGRRQDMPEMRAVPATHRAMGTRRGESSNHATTPPAEDTRPARDHRGTDSVGQDERSAAPRAAVVADGRPQGAPGAS
eukprot:7682088-Alexandrium_andersonii.AAC.1